MAQVDFKKRYYNDKLGLLWALINPGCQILVYYFVFKVIFQSKQENYALFLFSGILFWMAFAEISRKGMNILMTKSYLIENIQFAKIDLFISNSISVFFGLFFNLVAYLIISLFVGIPYTLQILILPILFLNLFLIATSISMILSIVRIFLKDIIHLWDVLLMIGFWTSGIFFKPDIYFNDLKFALFLNPFIGLLKHLRSVLLDGEPIILWLLCYNFVFGIIFLIVSNLIFNKYQFLALEKL